MSLRRRAREVALQILFEDDVNPRATAGELTEFLQGRLRNEEGREFALGLILGVRRNREAIDERLAQIAENWSLKRMAGADRNILRLGAYEALYGGAPHAVAVNEAVELAKRYGSAQSGGFVNGILDRLKEGVRPEA
ncbi:transcription antitermination factor NusB [Botrimarina sp.]|uniref:transcription antitermination factor NusB n=1 Tax=Botrimarina sp. TaxID=2795802 RepID=UPI0032ED0611